MVFGSHMIKPDLNSGRLERNKRGRANKSGCKGMLNEAVLKWVAVSQRNAKRKGGKKGSENEEMASL